VSTALHNPVSHSFVTTSGTNLSAWSDQTGSKIYSINKRFEAEVTAACFDDRRRKIIVGLANG